MSERDYAAAQYLWQFKNPGRSYRRELNRRTDESPALTLEEDNE